ncbi:MAG: hypothetical protein DRJ40_03850 [Thermoprotei archaeon]|nr:MAG: hypothetical protein DRJ40_03850 [Thermoprotei archaeon]
MSSRYIVRIFTLLAIVVFVVASLWYITYMSRPSRSTAPTTRVGVMSIGSLKSTKITILVDNNPYNDLVAVWGLSVLIELPSGECLLFDCGPSPTALLENCKKLGIEIDRVRYIVLSHEHGDHVGGITALSSLSKSITVFVPNGFPLTLIHELKSTGFRVTIVNSTYLITSGVAIVGPFRAGTLSEQVLVLNVSGVGLVVVTGCAHPGIENIVTSISETLSESIFLVVGGFHLVGADVVRLSKVAHTFEKLNVKYVVPIHCSGDRAREFLRSRLGNRVVLGHVGTYIEVSSKGITIKDLPPGVG